MSTLSDVYYRFLIAKAQKDKVDEQYNKLRDMLLKNFQDKHLTETTKINVSDQQVASYLVRHPQASHFLSPREITVIPCIKVSFDTQKLLPVLQKKLGTEDLFPLMSLDIAAVKNAAKSGKIPQAVLNRFKEETPYFKVEVK